MLHVHAQVNHNTVGWILIAWSNDLVLGKSDHPITVKVLSPYCIIVYTYFLFANLLIANVGNIHNL